MKTAAIYTITLLLSCNAFALQGKEITGENNQQQVVQLVNSVTTSQNMPMISASQTTFSAASANQTQPAKRQDELLTEISIYTLIVMVYSFYWMRVS